MVGRCRLSPHRGHYWVEEMPDSDTWECRWCGRIRHFNQERLEKAHCEDGSPATGYASQQWLSRQTVQPWLRHGRTGSVESDLGIYSTPSMT